MKPVKLVSGRVVPLDRESIDTDAIIPKQFLKSIYRTGFGPHLFDEWRYLDHGEPGMDVSGRAVNKDFVLNQPRYRGAAIMLGRHNFGCGSSREHAVWALQQYGIDAVIAPSFGDIFQNNSLKNGLVIVRLSADEVESLFQATYAETGYSLEIDVQAQEVRTPAGTRVGFELDPFKKHCLLQGLDEIGMALSAGDKIRAYQEQAIQRRPWLFE
jgi:3-isopropylmalate/(R)-2-methylmalate dehydratase small subunit